MRRRTLAALAAAALLASAVAKADYLIPVPAAGSNALVMAFACVISTVSKQCPAHVLIDSAGNEKGTLGNPQFGKSIPIDGTGAALGTAANPFRTSAVAKSPLGFQLLASLGSSTGLTVPSGATIARLCVEYQPVRYRDDGTAPTATTGMPLVPTLATVPVQPACMDYDGDLTAIRFIQQQTGAVVDVSYYK